MEKKKVRNINIEGARLVLKNFQGKPSMYNADGDRNFGVLLTEDEAERYAADGWNVKRFKAKPDDPDNYEQPWLSVKVRFDLYPPIAVLITSEGKINLTEDTIGQLDWTIFENCDVIVSPYSYPATATHPEGISAYLKAIYVTKDEDDFSRKYASIPYVNERRNE